MRALAPQTKPRRHMHGYLVHTHGRAHHSSDDRGRVELDRHEGHKCSQRTRGDEPRQVNDLAPVTTAVAFMSIHRRCSRCFEEQRETSG